MSYYKVLYGTSTSSLESKVNKHIQAGFKPIGGVSAIKCTVSDMPTGSRAGIIYHQAVLSEDV